VSRALTAGIHIPPKMYAAVAVWVATISPQKIPVRQIVNSRKIPIACQGDTARSRWPVTSTCSVTSEIVRARPVLGAACAPRPASNQ
jgi:hypothetical protein